MARKKTRSKRTYGTGCVIKAGNGLAIRWREPVLLPDGSVRRELKYEALGSVSRKEANQALRDRLAVSQVVRPGPITFEELARNWKTTVLPMYRKHSTRKHHAHILEKKLSPLFGNIRIDRIGRQYIQQVVSEWSGQGYSPSSIHHYHSVLSAILKKATEWGYIQFNPANGVKLPALVLVRPKPVLTPKQFGDLLSLLQPMARTQLLLMVLAGVRRGELFALRWRALDDSDGSNPKLTITEAVYEGVLDSPKTRSSLREVPLSKVAANALSEWRTIAPRTAAEDFIFSAMDGQRKRLVNTV